MHFWLLSLFSALLLIFSFPTADIAALAWLAFIPVFFLMEEAASTPKKLLFYSWITGIVFWAGLVYWVCYVSVAGFLALILLMSFFFPLFAWICRWIRKRSGLSYIWTAPIVWTALEYLRTYFLTGFPWGLLGATQHAFLPLIQISEWTGVYGVSFLVVLGNAWLFEVIYSILRKRESLRFTEAAVPLAILTTVFIYGGTFLAYPEKPVAPTEMTSANEPREIFFPELTPKKEEKKIRVTVVQGNIPQDIKIDKTYEGYIQEEYRKLTLEAVKKEKPDLVIWPETAIPSYLRYDEMSLEFLGGVIRETEIPFLLGSSDIQKVDPEKGFEPENRRYFNTAYLVIPGKGFAQQYDKIHLVPFGEYVPWEWIPFLRKVTPIEETYYPGKEFTVFDFAIPFSAVICFEDVFPNHVRHFVKKGARWLVNMTNDGWFRNSSAPMQHAVLALFRSVENRVWMVRSTNTGVSCFIDPFGRMTKLVENEQGKNIWVSGSASEEITSGGPTTFYTRFGDIFSWVNFGVVFLLMFIKKQKQSS